MTLPPKNPLEKPTPPKKNKLDQKLTTETRPVKVPPEKVTGRIAKSTAKPIIDSVHIASSQDTKDSLLDASQDLRNTIANRLKVATSKVQDIVTYIPKELNESKLNKVNREIDAAKKNQVSEIADKTSGIVHDSASIKRNIDQLEKTYKSTLGMQEGAVKLAHTQAGLLQNIYLFNISVAQQYYTKSLALEYKQVFMTRDLLEITRTIGSVIENKLEAIKLNTSAPEASKRSFIDLAREVSLRNLANTMYDKFNQHVTSKAIGYVSPLVQDRVVNPLKDRSSKLINSDNRVTNTLKSVKSRVDKLREQSINRLAEGGASEYSDDYDPISDHDFSGRDYGGGSMSTVPVRKSVDSFHRTFRAWRKEYLHNTERLIAAIEGKSSGEPLPDVFNKPKGPKGGSGGGAARKSGIPSIDDILAETETDEEKALKPKSFKDVVNEFADKHLKDKFASVDASVREKVDELKAKFEDSETKAKFDAKNAKAKHTVSEARNAAQYKRDQYKARKKGSEEYVDDPNVIEMTPEGEIVDGPARRPQVLRTVSDPTRPDDWSDMASDIVSGVTSNLKDNIPSSPFTRKPDLRGGVLDGEDVGIVIDQDGKVSRPSILSDPLGSLKDGATSLRDKLSPPKPQTESDSKAITIAASEIVRSIRENDSTGGSSTLGDKIRDFKDKHHVDDRIDDIKQRTKPNLDNVKAFVEKLKAGEVHAPSAEEIKVHYEGLKDKYHVDDRIDAMKYRAQPNLDQAAEFVEKLKAGKLGDDDTIQSIKDRVNKTRDKYHVDDRIDALKYRAQPGMDRVSDILSRGKFKKASGSDESLNDPDYQDIEQMTISDRVKILGEKQQRISEQLDESIKTLRNKFRPNAVNDDTTVNDILSQSKQTMQDTIEGLNARMADTFDKTLGKYFTQKDNTIRQDNEPLGSGFTQDFTPIVSSIDALHETMKEWRQEYQQSTETMMQLIASIPAGGGDGTPGKPGMFSGGVGDFANRALLGAAKFPFKMGWKAAKVGVKGYAKMTSISKGVTFAVGGALFGGRISDPFCDIYTKDEQNNFTLLVKKKDLVKGLAFADDGKPVFHVKDIDRPVLDPRTETIVITQEDIDKGLLDRKGVPLTKRRYTHSIAGDITRGVMGGGVAGIKAAGGIAKAIFSPKNPMFSMYGTIFKSVASLVGGVGGFLGKGALAALNPKLAGTVFKGLGGIAKPLFGMYGNLFAMGTKLVSSVVSTGAGLIANMFGFGKGRAGITRKDMEEVLAERLDDIYELLEGHFSKSRVSGDTDGDGDRDGSYEDYMQKLKDKRAARAERDAARNSLGGKTKGALGGLAAILGLGKKKKTMSDAAKDGEEEEDGEGGGGGLVESAFGAWLASKIPGVKNVLGKVGRGLGKGVKAVGGALGATVSGAAGLALGGAKLLGKGAIGAGKLVGKAGAALASTSVVKGAASMAGTALKTVGGAAGSVLAKMGASSLLKKIPGIGLLVGIGLGINRLMDGDLTGAAGEGLSGLVSLIPGFGTAASIAIDGYLGYRDYNKDDFKTKLFKARMESYGITDPGLYDYVKSLEEQMYDILLKKSPKLDDEKDFKKIADNFGLITNDPEVTEYFAAWFKNRFCRCFVTYNKCLSTQNLSFSDEKSLTEDQAKELLSMYNDETGKFVKRYKELVPTMEAFNKLMGRKDGPKTKDTIYNSRAKKLGVPETKSKDAPGTGGSDDMHGGAGADTLAAGVVAGSAASAASVVSGLPYRDNNRSMGANIARDQRGKARIYSAIGGGVVSGTSAYGQSSGGVEGSSREEDYSGIPAPAAKGLGSLSAVHESGKRGSMAIGWDGTGGTSYGKYQIAAKTGTFRKFLAWLQVQPGNGPIVAKRLISAGNAETGSRSGPVPEEWKKIVKEGLMGDLEHGFIKASHYDPAYNGLSGDQKKLIEGSPALQDVLWSTAVQHGAGGASRIFGKTFTNEGPEAWINNIYKYRGTQFGRSSPGVQASVRKRFAMERAQALAMLKNEGNKPEGDTATASNDNAAGGAAPVASSVSGGSGDSPASGGGAVSTDVGSMPGTSAAPVSGATPVSGSDAPAAGGSDAMAGGAGQDTLGAGLSSPQTGMSAPTPVTPVSSPSKEITPPPMQDSDRKITADAMASLSGVSGDKSVAELQKVVSLLTQLNAIFSGPDSPFTKLGDSIREGIKANGKTGGSPTINIPVVPNQQTQYAGPSLDLDITKKAS